MATFETRYNATADQTKAAAAPRIKRALKRRLAASFDNLEGQNDKLFAAIETLYGKVGEPENFDVEAIVEKMRQIDANKDGQAKINAVHTELFGAPISISADEEAAE